MSEGPKHQSETELAAYHSTATLTLETSHPQAKQAMSFHALAASGEPKTLLHHFSFFLKKAVLPNLLEHH